MKAIGRRRGAIVRYGGEEMKVVATPDFGTLTLQNARGEYLNASIADIEKEAAAQPNTAKPIDQIRQAKVTAYVAALGPLLGRTSLTRSEVSEAAGKLDISVSAAYRALARFRIGGSTADLPPPTRPGGRGRARIDPKAEKLVQETIETTLLNRRNHTPRTFYKAVTELLRKKGLKVSQATLRNRVKAIPDYKWARARKGAMETARTHDPLKGIYPDVAAPLALIQMDHWKMDCDIVSDDRLTNIGRGWLTLAIDIFSRMAWGFHIGLDAPSTTTIGLAMVSGMTQKGPVMAEYGLSYDYPIAGKPVAVMADNAKEFRGESFQTSCGHFNIKLTWRPLQKPQYGGHIERLNNTLAQAFKALPGATGANIKERKDFQPEKTAAFTLEDLTKQIWLIINAYHNEVHTGIGMTPIEKYRSYFFGPNGQKHALPDVWVNDLPFRREWYPIEMRSLQAYGILIDHLKYYCEEISQLVKNRKNYGDVLVRRNPFDVREIFVLHPDRNEYIVVPTRHLGFPAAALWQLADSKREALKRKRAPTPEVLAEIIREQQAHIEQSQKKTKTAQRKAARLSHHEKLRKATAVEDAKLEREDRRDAARMQDAAVTPSVAPMQPGVPMPPAAAVRNRLPKPVKLDETTDLTSILAALSEEEIERNLDD